MDSKRLFSSLEKLNFVRVSRTEEERKAAQIILKEIETAGGQGYIEKFDVSDWKIKTQKFYVNSPIYKEYDVTGYGCCANTNGPLTAPFYYFDTFTKVSREKAKDKIVLVNGYLTYDTYKEIASSGAVGFITFSNDVYEDETNSDLDVRELRKLMSDIKKLPGVHMRSKDAMDLVKLNPETVTIEIEQEEFVSQSQNVISTIKGKMLEEEIVITAHYDSVPFSRGVYDNGAGSAIILELYRYFINNKPLRTLRFIWCGSEERGLLGSKAFVKKHNKELKNIILCLNVDVAGPVLGKDSIVVMANDPAVKFIEEYRNKIEYVCDVKSDTYSSDSIPFADKGIPGLNFMRFGTQGTAHIHTRKDTLYFMSEDALYNTYKYVLKFTNHFANVEEFPIARKIDRKMKDKICKYLKKRKKDK